jgi:enoyl-CoA hydratase/carnithine racemase
MLAGPMRALLMEGHLVDGRTAVQIGLATHLANSGTTLHAEARDLIGSLEQKGPIALRTTKAWLNQLDGSNDDDTFDATVTGSSLLATEPEAIDMLRTFWNARSRSRDHSH